jgi:hypothetical protein
VRFKIRPQLVAISLFLLPVASLADVIDIPALGVRFADMPAGVTNQSAIERPHGYEWLGHLGVAFLSVYRDDESVSPGSAVLDSNYRATLDARHRTALTSAERTGAASTLASRPAWIVTEVRSLAQARVCDWLAYVIVDEHLYTLTVGALSQSGTPSEFDSLVKAMSSVQFESIQRTLSPPLRSGEMPRFVSSGEQFYPPKARRLNEQGAVGVAFSIDGRGHARDMKLLYADVQDLVPSAAEWLKDGIFRVPSNWEETASDKQRFFLEIQFLIVAGNVPCSRSPSAHNPEAEVVAICTHTPDPAQAIRLQ